MTPPQLNWTSERSVWLHWGDAPAPNLTQLADTIRATLITEARSVTACPEGILVELNQPIRSAKQLQERILLTSSSPQAGSHAPRTHLIRVCYDPRLAPDLDAVAQASAMTTDGVVRAHLNSSFRVGSIGFAPGFGYLQGLDTRLILPRRRSPRTVVPEGSVAIAESMSAIYPARSAGGWNLIGRTNQVMFDPARDEPCLLAAGDRVQFVSISFDEYQSERGV